MGFTVLIILCFILTCLFISYQHHKDEPIKSKRNSNILFNSLNVENKIYSSEENIFKTLDEAGIEVSFIENKNI